MASTTKTKKRAARKRPAAAPPPPTGGRPERVPGGGSAGQLAVRLSKRERRELDTYAHRVNKTSAEVVRIALRNMGVISAPEAATAA